MWRWLALAAAVPIAWASRCEDDATFKDEIGMSCENWIGENCSSTDNVDYMGYTRAGVDELIAKCPEACGTCTPPPTMTATVKKMVVVGFDLGSIDLTGLALSPEQIWKESMAVAFDVTTNEILELVLDVAAARGTFHVVSQPRSVLSNAFSVAQAGGGKNLVLKIALANRGVDVSAGYNVTASQRSVATTNAKVLAESTDLDTFLGVLFVNDPPETAWCFDEPTFYDKIGLKCEDWIGYDCTDVNRWTSGELQDGYTEADLNKVARWCPQSCGMCKPPAQKTNAQLLAQCEDDVLKEGLCSRWRGINCNWATQMGFSTAYQTQLLERCPLSCGTCAPAAGRAECADAIGFLDELGKPCTSWVGSNCGIIKEGYTRRGMLDVLSHCHKSCSICFSPSAAVDMTPSTIDGYFGKLISKANHHIFELGRQYETCEDDKEYSYVKMFKCSDFVGKACTIGSLYLDQRWLLSPAGEGVGPWGNWYWHKQLWQACPVSCGLCSPPNRETKEDLLTECYDDPYDRSWCEYRYGDIDCHDWQGKYNVAFGKEGIAKMNTTIFTHCPKTCGLCTAPVCPAGTFRNRTAHTCQLCEPGTFSSEARSGDEAVACAAAAAGDYVEEYGATDYARCEPGTFSGEAKSTGCIDCLAGSYSDAFSSTECTLCKPGWYQDLDNATACVPCPQGQYTAMNASTACEVCPIDRTTHWNKAVGITDCSCPEGTYQPLGMVSADCEPCPKGLECPGGHPYMNPSVDMTGIMKEGFMTMPDDPWLVYTCKGGADACPGSRASIKDASRFSSICSQGRTGLRCATCPSGTYMRFGQCDECGDLAGLDTFGKGLVLFIIQFAFVARAYMLQGKETSESWIMGMSFITFCQVLQLLSQIDLEWPAEILGFFEFMTIFSINGIFELLAFKGDCIFGISPVLRLLRDAAIPLLPLVDFAIIWVWYKFKARALRKVKVLNVMGIIWTGYFVSICEMAVQLFPYEQMPTPNTKRFVRDIPTVELYSEEWFKLLPISVLCLLVYCAAFIFYVARAVILAPSRVCRDQDFSKQYNFFLGDVNPSSWWWIAIILPYYLGLNLVQAFSGDVFVQVYISMLLLTVIILIHLSVQPSIYRSVNSVQLTLHIAHLVFLIFATAFFKEEDLETQNSVLHAWIMVIVIAFVLSYTAYNILAWIHGSLRTTPLGQAARVAFRARDIMTLLAQMPDSQFMGLASRMLEVDRELLEKTTDMLVGVFLKEQPQGSKMKQRVIVGNEFKVWNPGQTAAETFRQVRSKNAHKVFEDNVKIQLRAQRLADDLKKARCGPLTVARRLEEKRKKAIEEEEQNQKGWAVGLKRCKRRMLEKIAKTPLLAGLKHFLSVFMGSDFVIKMDEDEFVEQVQPQTRLSEMHLRDMFKLFDLKGDKVMPVADFFHLLAAMTPNKSGELDDDENMDDVWGDEPEEEQGIFGALKQKVAQAVEQATGLVVDDEETEEEKQKRKSERASRLLQLEKAMDEVCDEDAREAAQAKATIEFGSDDANEAGLAQAASNQEGAGLDLGDVKHGRDEVKDV